MRILLICLFLMSPAFALGENCITVGTAIKCPHVPLPVERPPPKPPRWLCERMVSNRIGVLYCQDIARGVEMWKIDGIDRAYWREFQVTEETE